jgi:hypothetical protein
MPCAPTSVVYLLENGCKPGMRVTWTDCPSYLEWMQPFSVVNVNTDTKHVELEGIRHFVPMSKLLALALQ